MKNRETTAIKISNKLINNSEQQQQILNLRHLNTHHRQKRRLKKQHRVNNIYRMKNGTTTTTTRNDQNNQQRVGNELHLHTADKQNTCGQKLPMRLSGKVHGIVAGTDNNRDKLLVYGEKEYLLLQWTEEYAFHIPHCGQVTDWISAAKFLIDANHFVLLTAHSIVLRLEYLPAAKTCKIVQRSSCSDKSTLYCAAVYGQRWSELVCFGGNAFGELLVWQPLDAKVPLLQRISSHNGVIFSINYNAEANMLTTTSDDRSIRLWRVKHCSSEEWKNATFIPLASGFGHVARVFQGRIIKCAGQFYAISVGEDSFMCVWRNNGELIHKCRQQFGATIWNFEYDEAIKILYTVGSTGNVISYNLEDVFDREIKAATTKSPALLPPLIKMAAKNDDKIVDCYVAKIKFLTPDLLVGVTNKNQLIYHKTKTADWQLVDDFAHSKCTVLEVYAKHLAICGYKRLTLYRFTTDAFTEPFEKYYNSNNILNGVIRAFKFLTEDRFLICDEGGNCLLLHELPTGSLEEYIISLPKCKEPWLTSAALIDKQFLLICNRQGNIFLYNWNETQHSFTHVFTLKHPHGNLGATLIKLVDDGADIAFLKTAGHDGSIKYLKLCKSKATLNVVRREIVPVAWVEALEEISSSDAVELLLGFNDNHFVVWSKLYDFSVQLACGGGHRCWDYYIHRTPATAFIKLAFIKNKQVLLHKFELFNTSSSPAIRLPPRNMWHVKPCNVMACVEKEVKGQNEGRKIVIVSGGDDNLLKISQCIIAPTSQQQHQLKQLTEVHSHISNIRALKVLKINEAAASDYLIFSGGGRAQLCVTKFNLSTFQLEEMLNVTLKAEAQTEKGNTIDNFSIDPETRIMSLDVLPATLNDADTDGEADEGYLIFIGCSDGFVRKYRLTKNWQFTLLTEINYGKCILNVRLVDNFILLIAATDGYIRCSNLEMTRVEIISQHHASGINALDIRYNRETEELQLLTGGDDQKLVYSKLSLTRRRSITEVPSAVAVLETLNFDHLHTAQVTAVQMSICGRYIYSGGVDQNLFKLDLHTQQLVEKFHSCVADVKGLRLCASDKVCFLYGCGLQVHALQSVDLEVKQ